jgi:murein DD-endopeptidase MepM/ murein hydrolase activator NlpD
MVDRRPRSGKKTPVRRISPARSGTIRLTLILGALLLVNVYVFFWRDSTSIPAVMDKAASLGKGGPVDEAAAPEAPGIAAAATGGEVIPDEPAPAPTTTSITGEVGKGDTLGKILKKQGLDADETDQVLRALAEVFDFKSLKPGQQFVIERAADGTLQSFQLTISKVKTVRVERAADGSLTGVADQAQTRVEVEEVAGRIDSSLYASIKNAGESTSLVAFFVDVFAYDLDFYTETHPGDTFRVLVEKEYKDQEFLRYRRILAAQYQGKAGTYQAFYWEGKAKKGRYYDEKARSVEKSLLKTPLKYARVSSGFNPKRMHPILHKVRGHYGVDYAAPTGTPVWAAASGTIITRGNGGGTGNIVVIKHDDGLVTKYMHLSKFAAGQKVGQRVEAKTVIGYVGSTGLSTGPHLHFGVTKNGVHVDPLKLAPTRGRGVPKEDLAAYKAHVAEMERTLAAIPVGTATVATDERAPTEATP